MRRRWPSVVVLGLALLGCERKPDAPGSDADTPATPQVAAPAGGEPTVVEPAPAEPATDEPAPAEPTAAGRDTAAIVGVDSAVTGSGIPGHLRFSLVDDTAKPLTIELVELRSVETPAGPLGVHELQLWIEGADEPITIAPGEALTLEPGTTAELLVYLDSWSGDPLADHYRFEAEFRVDDVARTIPLTVTRARREPLRR